MLSMHMLRLWPQHPVSLKFSIALPPERLIVIGSRVICCAGTLEQLYGRPPSCSRSEVVLESCYTSPGGRLNLPWVLKKVFRRPQTRAKAGACEANTFLYSQRAALDRGVRHIQLHNNAHHVQRLLACAAARSQSSFRAMPGPMATCWTGLMVREMGSAWLGNLNRIVAWMLTTAACSAPGAHAVYAQALGSLEICWRSCFFLRRSPS